MRTDVWPTRNRWGDDDPLAAPASGGGAHASKPARRGSISGVRDTLFLQRARKFMRAGWTEMTAVLVLGAVS